MQIEEETWLEEKVRFYDLAVGSGVNNGRMEHSERGAVPHYCIVHYTELHLLKFCTSWHSSSVGDHLALVD